MKILKLIGSIICWLIWWLLMPIAALCADQFDSDFRQWIDLRYPRNWKPRTYQDGDDMGA